MALHAGYQSRPVSEAHAHVTDPDFVFPPLQERLGMQVQGGRYAACSGKEWLDNQLWTSSSRGGQEHLNTHLVMSLRAGGRIAPFCILMYSQVGVRICHGVEQVQERTASNGRSQQLWSPAMHNLLREPPSSLPSIECLVCGQGEIAGQCQDMVRS